MFGPVLNDPEFDAALARAEQVWIENVQNIQDYPFSLIQRKKAVHWYATLGRAVWLIPQRTSCSFEDTDEVTEEEAIQILRACQYGFFSWSTNNAQQIRSFEPDSYMTKGTSLVALMKWLFPDAQFPETEPYWTPYIQRANEMGVATREPGPYVNYLITQYELLLQLYRASERRASNR